MKEYVVIGGQYGYFCYGSCESLHQAKILATKNQEYWDNWQGWHTPSIYKSDDCQTDGVDIFPKPNRHPLLVKADGKWSKWHEYDY